MPQSAMSLSEFLSTNCAFITPSLPVPDHVGTLHDDQYLSDDSLSTLSTYSDLDYNLNLDVRLPDGSVRKTSLAAHTPWSDVRTHMCSQFKLNPTNHIVDFESHSALNMKRKASRPVGKLDIVMITIKEKGQHTKHHAPPLPPFNAIDKGSVRLIVRLPRSRQSILRVNPDAPLSNIFKTVSDKLKLDEQSKDGVEFRHPLQHEVKLNSELSLNQYNIREVYLTQKSAQKPKRKAPPPPRPPPPDLSARSKSTSSVEVKPPAETMEPVYAQVKKKPKPMKRRSAPLPPQVVDSTSENETPIAAMTSATQHEQNGKAIAPSRTSRKHKQLKKVFQEEGMPGSDVDDITKKHVHTIVDDANVYASIDDVTQVYGEEKMDNLTEKTKDNVNSVSKQDDAVIVDDNGLVEVERASPSIEEELRSEDDFVSEEEEGDNDIMKTLDDAFDQLDDATLTEDDSDEDKLKADAEFAFDDEAWRQEDKSTPQDVMVSPSDDETFPIHEETVPLPKKTATRHEAPAPQNEMASPNLKEVAPVVDENVAVSEDSSGDEEESPRARETEHSDVETTTMGSITRADDDKTRLKVGDTAVKGDDIGPSEEIHPVSDPTNVTSSLAALKLANDVVTSDTICASETTGVRSKDNKNLSSEVVSLPYDYLSKPVAPSVGSRFAEANLEQSDEFDLHIAESFNIPLQSLDEQKSHAKEETTNIEGQLTEKASRLEAVTVNPQPKKINHEKAAKDVPSVKSSQELENEQTAKEIEKLHQQIKKMRKRSSLKQMETDTGSRNSFTFVPTKKRESLHDDYDVAPVSGIQLSNSGEIKVLQRDEKKTTDKGPVLHAEALKQKANLPSYYKKFLGVRAFAAKDST